MTNPFWDFSLASYSRDGVPGSCLALQDDFNLDVNMLLYGAWLASQDKRLDTEHLAALEVVIKPWREQVVEPLRALRRRWREYPPAGVLRGEVKRLELQAERQQQDMMLAFLQAASEPPAACQPLEENLVQVACFTCPDQAGWRQPVRRLASKLSP
ncbi:TIGR02444 family protein [bacterium]|nr:TIGR02444 family protein [bacterium]